LGLAPICYENASTTLHEIDRHEYRIVARRTVRDFRAASLRQAGDGVLAGGEALDNCSPRGTASIVRFPASGEAQPFWTDHRLFPRSVRAIAVAGNEILAAVSRDRPLGISVRVNKRLAEVGYKRWSERSDIIREASIVALAANGRAVRIQDLSAGLSGFIGGIASTPQGVIVYGSLGGVPAMMRQ
jgi:hypothetical protein